MQGVIVTVNQVKQIINFLRLVPESDVVSLVLMEVVCSSVVYWNVSSLVSIYVGSSVSKDGVCSSVGSRVYKDSGTDAFEPEDVGDVVT